MAWTAPQTMLSNTVLTAATWNQQVRDNLLCTAPALATQAGQIFVSTAANTVVARNPTTAVVTATDTDTTLTYVDLATVGPTVTCDTGTSALVTLTCSSFNNANNASWMSYAVSGASSIAASDPQALQFNSSAGQRYSARYMVTGLTAGTNTFRAKYRTSTSGTSTWSQRMIIVEPL